MQCQEEASTFDPHSNCASRDATSIPNCDISLMWIKVQLVSTNCNDTLIVQRFLALHLQYSSNDWMLNSAPLSATRILCRPDFVTTLDTHWLPFQLFHSSHHRTWSPFAETIERNMRTRGGISSICQVLPSHPLDDDLMLLAISHSLFSWMRLMWQKECCILLSPPNRCQWLYFFKQIDRSCLRVLHLVRIPCHGRPRASLRSCVKVPHLWIRHRITFSEVPLSNLNDRLHRVCFTPLFVISRS